MSVVGHGGAHFAPSALDPTVDGHDLNARRQAPSVTRRPVRLEAKRPPQRDDPDGQRSHREQHVQHRFSMAYHTSTGHTRAVPELLEAEMYRRGLERIVGGEVVAVPIMDALVVPEGRALRDVLVGVRVHQVRRHGKVVTLHTERATVGLRFGMTGRVVVGGDEPIPALAYGPSAGGTRFDRWEVHLRRQETAELVSVRLSDPRRLARVQLNPDLSGLGPDATEVDATALGERLRGRRAPIKAVLLDQAVIAGLGNLLADELLWRCGVAPDRPADTLTAEEISTMAAALPRMLDQLMTRGGSHRGDLAVEMRRPGAACPLDGTMLARRSIGGRTSWSCPLHQR